MVDNNTLTAIAAFLGASLGIVNFLHARLWRDKIRIRSDLVKRSVKSAPGLDFEVRNKSFLSVTITDADISLHRSASKPMLFVNAMVSETFLSSKPHLLEPRTSVTVRFAGSGEEFYATEPTPQKKRLHDQGYGFIHVKTACGKTFTDRFDFSKEMSLVKKWGLSILSAVLFLTAALITGTLLAI